jgi:hypothetical protein
VVPWTAGIIVMLGIVAAGMVASVVIDHHAPVPASPLSTATHFYDAWISGNRTAAGHFATPEAVNDLFTYPVEGGGPFVRPKACQRWNHGFRCGLGHFVSSNRVSFLVTRVGGRYLVSDVMFCTGSGDTGSCVVYTTW